MVTLMAFMYSRSHWFILALLVLVQVQSVLSEDECKPGSKSFDKSSNPSDAVINKGIKHWEGFLLIAAFGAFGLFISIVYRLVRRCFYDDGDVLDAYFDAGGDINFALVACAVVGRWFWSAGFTWSTASVYEFGIVGQFWYAAAGATVLLLFTMAGFELRLKAPGAKTFLQVVNARYGPGPHIVVMIFAITLNAILASSILMEASRILNSLHQDTNAAAICAVLCLAVAASSVIGGVGGGVYMSYFTSLLISGISLVYVIHTFKDTVDDSPGSERWGDEKKIYTQICGLAGATNKTKDDGLLTFHSRYALMEGILILLCGLSSVFVNQSFWTGAVISRPLHTVCGYILGAITWFSLPFMLALSFGVAYWTLAAEEGKHIVSADQAKYGHLAVFVSQKLLGNLGDYLFYSLTLAATISVCSSEVLSITSILIYDVYQAYIGPRMSSSDATCPQSGDRLYRYWRHLRQVDYMKYCIVVVVSFILFGISQLLVAIDIDFPWMYKFLGVICGSAVFPIILSVGYFRTRATGVFLGPILGLVCGLITWLVYASSFPGGLNKFRMNTGRQEVFIAGAAMSVGTGGLVTVLFSIFLGSCYPRLDRLSTWAKTRLIDNPLRPWATLYTGQDGTSLDFNSLRVLLMPAERIAYFVAPVLAIGAVVLWPALMLLAEHFSQSQFSAWIWVAIIWGGITAGLLALFGLMFWLLEICCNGSCEHFIDDTSDTKVIEEDDVMSVNSRRYLTGVRHHHHHVITPVITPPPPVVSARAPPHRHVISTAAPRLVEPVSAYSPLPEPVSTYAPGEIRGLRTTVDYVKPVTRYHNHHYHEPEQNQYKTTGSDVDYVMAGGQRFKTTINLDD